MGHYNLDAQPTDRESSERDLLRRPEIDYDFYRQRAIIERRRAIETFWGNLLAHLMKRLDAESGHNG